ncbi:MAG TPA: cytochrome D1 domain-containing protein, partial [Burkholderiales bacterium]|nr:cytochrome D1 domain-containing protein [Burkholderiales bacterium]
DYIAAAGERLFVPAVGRHELLVIDAHTWKERARLRVAGQPVFVVARPDGRHVWVNFAPPHNDTVQVLDTESLAVVQALKPGKAVLHMEFTPRGEQVWVSVRDDNMVRVYDTDSFAELAALPADKPSGIFFSARAHRTGQ